MFSATVITGMSMKCWCTIPIPRVDRVLRPSANVTGLPLRRISPSSGLVEPVEDVHQRRLAGAVLAEQRVHLAAAEVEVDVVVRDDAREALRDAAQLEDRRRRHRPILIAGAILTTDRSESARGGLAARPSAERLIATPRATTSDA